MADPPSPPVQVLLADDSRTSRNLLGQMLESWGYEVVVCEDGAEAWKVLSQPNAPRLAILDWEMPGIDGIDLVRRLREQRDDRHVFVFLLTARTAEADMLVGLEAGADDYLTKPVNPAELRVRLRNGTRLVALQGELLQAREELRTQALKDPLTGVWNRRALESLAEAQFARCRRQEAPTAALLLVDLDHFKGVNDTHGHAAGDQVLVAVAKRMEGVLREGDEIARMGGEEFVLLLPSCHPLGVFEAAERVRRAICAGPVTWGEALIPITASIGAATLRADDAFDAMLQRADVALYDSKRAGRNRSTVDAPEGGV